MATFVNVPNIGPQQATSIFGQQTTSQPSSIINISSLMNLMLPIMIMGMMMKMMANMVSAPKRVTATTIESNPPSHEQASATTATAG